MVGEQAGRSDFPTLRPHPLRAARWIGAALPPELQAANSCMYRTQVQAPLSQRQLYHPAQAFLLPSLYDTCLLGIADRVGLVLRTSPCVRDVLPCSFPSELIGP